MGHQAKVSVRDLVYQPGGQSRGGDREGGVDPCNQIGIGEPFEAAHFRILGLQPGADGQGSWREVLVEEALEFQFPASRTWAGRVALASMPDRLAERMQSFMARRAPWWSAGRIAPYGPAGGLEP